MGLIRVSLWAEWGQQQHSMGRQTVMTYVVSGSKILPRSQDFDPALKRA
jgi:hypothetical protein